MQMVVKPAPRSQIAFENALAIGLLAMVWLAPNHQLPWSSFHHELLMAVALSIVCAVVLWQTRWPFPFSGFAALTLLAAFLPWVQHATGLLPKSGTALISSSYIAALALAICVGHAASRASDQRFFFILFGALALAAGLNVPVQLIQWYQVHQWLSHDFDALVLLLVTPVSGGQRPSGMILQPNQLATIQVWGLIGLTWFRYHRLVRLSVFVACFGSIAFGIGLTQSRAGLLEMTVALLTFVAAFRSAPRRDIVWTWGCGIALLVLWSFHFATVAEWLGVHSASDAVARVSAIDGARLDAWRAFWGAVLERPWTGYGITDSGYAYVALASEHPDIFIGQRFAHAHNAVLDLFLWVGIPLGLLACAAFLIWLAPRLKSVPQQPHKAFPMAIVLVVGLHAMLELPHQFLYFIVPTGMCIGALCDVHRSASFWTLPRWAWGAAGAIVVAVMTPIALDYFPYQARYTEWRYENARVGKRPNIDVHEPFVLNQIHDELALYRLPLGIDMPEDQLKWVADTARSVNSPPAFYAAAMAFALAGERDEAHVWMMRLNAILQPDGVKQMKTVWHRNQLQYPKLVDLSWPDYQGRASTFVMSSQEDSSRLLPTETGDSLPALDLPNAGQPVSQVR